MKYLPANTSKNWPATCHPWTQAELQTFLNYLKSKIKSILFLLRKIYTLIWSRQKQKSFSSNSKKLAKIPATEKQLLQEKLCSLPTVLPGLQPTAWHSISPACLGVTTPCLGLPCTEWVLTGGSRREEHRTLAFLPSKRLPRPFWNKSLCMYFAAII